MMATRLVADPATIHDHLPVGVVVIDAGGTIHSANRRAIDMTGYSAGELVGRSIVDFVDPADRTFLVASLVHAGNYAGGLLGPVRARYLHRDGSARLTECWAQAGSRELGYDGYVITLSTESVGDNVADAIHLVASGAPIERPLSTLARAVSGHPLVACGAILVPNGDGVDVHGVWPFDGDEGLRPHPDVVALPWIGALLDGANTDLDVEALPPSLAAAARQAGFRSLWIRPVHTRQAGVVAVFVAWRTEPGGASPNQERHLAEVVAAAGLAFDASHHRESLERAARHDPLTGLGNRAALALQLQDSDGDRLAVLYVDLDGFKRVNDQHGHGVGDQVLSIASRRILAAVRASDVVFRVGGDEFVVLCSDLRGDPDPATALATRIVTTLSDPIAVGAGLTVSVGASVGIAERLPGEGTARVIGRADHALLAAKRNGKGRWHHADHSPPPTVVIPLGERLACTYP